MPTLTIKSDKPMVLISLEEYESLKETIEILSNPKLMRDIRRAQKDFREGKTVPLEQVRAELELPAKRKRSK